MAQQEIIENITFFVDRAAAASTDSDKSQCWIETNMASHIINIKPGMMIYDEEIDVSILNQDFSLVDENDFIGAQLVRVVDDFNELIRNEKFASYYKNIIKTGGEFRFFEFQTSKGIFYIQASVWNDGEYPHVIEYVVEPIDESLVNSIEFLDIF